MKIAQVSPLYESVPPKLYGGTERVVSYLTEQLVSQGHDVTLFASGDSVTSANLVSTCSQSLRLNKDCVDQMAPHLVMLEQVAQLANQFDIIHFHCDYLHFPITRRLNVCNVTTLHGRLDIRDLHPIFQEFQEMPLISISDSQRKPMPWANWCGTVYHGLPEDSYPVVEQPGKYLAFLGRISHEKGIEPAIEIAKRCNMELKIAAKIGAQDQEYFDEVIKPLLDHPLISFIGEIGEAEKGDFLGNAYAVLFPIQWPEPFGLVMIESMACGTPVIAFPCGSVPEIMDDYITGFVVADVDSAVKAVEQLSSLDRRRCRQVFEYKFSSSRMAQDYLAIYKKLIEERTPSIMVA